MAEYQVTIDGADLQKFVQGDDEVKVCMEKVLNQVLQAQASEQLQAGLAAMDGYQKVGNTDANQILRGPGQDWYARRRWCPTG